MNWVENLPLATLGSFGFSELVGPFGMAVGFHETTFVDIAGKLCGTPLGSRLTDIFGSTFTFLTGVQKRFQWIAKVVW